MDDDAVRVGAAPLCLAEGAAVLERDLHVPATVGGRDHGHVVPILAELFHLRVGVRPDAARPGWERRHDEDPHAGRQRTRRPAPSSSGLRGIRGEVGDEIEPDSVLTP